MWLETTYFTGRYVDNQCICSISIYIYIFKTEYSKTLYLKGPLDMTAVSTAPHIMHTLHIDFYVSVQYSVFYLEEHCHMWLLSSSNEVIRVSIQF